MKIFKLMAIALVAMVGLNSCSEDCDHDLIDVDHSSDLVGTWTCLEAGYAEALVIKADGSALSTGVEDGEYWENVAGDIVVKNGIATMTFEDGDNFKGHFDIVPGVAFSIYTDEGAHLTFYYCKEDLADEIVGMWVCNDYSTGVENDMVIQTFKEDGTVTKTGWSAASNEFIVNETITYKVVGDLVFHQRPSEMVAEGAAAHFASKLTYMPNANQLGDMLTNTSIKVINGEAVELSASMLRIKQSLDLAGKGYYYNYVFVSNVDGVDQDIDFMGHTFNFAKMNGSELNKFLNSLLFNVEFPDANTIQYIYMYNNAKEVLEAPIAVDGNKLTVKMSANEPALKDVVFYAFQDADNSQLHFYMHKTAFVNFYTNMQAMLMEATDEQFDINNAEAVNAIYNEINNAVETINVSLVFKARK